MICSRYHGLIRFHFLLKVVGGIALYWLLVVFASQGGFASLTPLALSRHAWLTIVIFAAAYLEKRLRPWELSLVGTLPREGRSEVNQRELLFAFSAFLGVIVLSKDTSMPIALLGLFLLSYSLWICWMNHSGFHLINHLFYANDGSVQSRALVLTTAEYISSDEARFVKDVLPGSNYFGYVQFGDGETNLAPGADSRVLGHFSNLAALCTEHKAKVLLILGIEDRPQLVKSLQRMCDAKGMRMIWVDDKTTKFGSRLESYRHGSRVFYTNWSEPLEEPLNRFLKRLFDLVISGTAVILVLPPLMALVSLMHRRFSPGPLFFRQKRTGRNGEVIDVLKFRSMHANNTPGRQVSEAGDPRIFKGGAFLRKSSLDEIPQFLNVLRGEMSVVGPRPHFVDHDAEFENIAQDYRVRQFAKPGITGLAQVKGFRGETNTARKLLQRVRLDNFYLRHWSLQMDLMIVFLTIWQVLFPPKSAR